jgi:multiple sugar transport system permease protein
MKDRARTVRSWFAGMAFLLPSLLGFCAFTLVPLTLSFAMAFTDWDIMRHNQFRHEPLHFTGLENFIRLLGDPQFWRDLGNTFYLMLGLPFAMAGSLGAALLLTRVSRRRSAVGPALVAATLVLIASGLGLLWGGMAESGVWFLFGLLAASVLLAGVLTGGTVYRTLFYLPSFTSGVATYVLWKKLYNPHSGPINLGLAPVLDRLTLLIRSSPGVFTYGLPAICAGLAAGVVAWQVRRLRNRWSGSEAGLAALVTGALALAVPLGLLLSWQGFSINVAVGVAAAAAVVMVVTTLRLPRTWGRVRTAEAGLGAEFALAMLALPLLLVLAAGIRVGPALPALAVSGIEPPDWLGSYGWAKPALMMVSLWAAIGSNNMILYLAGLGGIPPELYEAADMDGASASQRFWHITWPQLAPVTFFIGVMGIINGMQGGFEVARTMTAGGPAGATTTLSYYIFSEGFETGRLGYASAIAWMLFALVFGFSLLNFRFGNRDAND